MVQSVTVPLVPVYAFNKAGQAIQLYRGGIGGLAAGDVTGSVEFRCTPEPSVVWSVDPGSPPYFANRRDEIPMVLHRPDGDMEFPGYALGFNGGWSNGAAFGSGQTPVNRILAHWFNLPDWHGPEVLEDAAEGDGQSWWRGRWVMRASGWTITLDVRPDHPTVWRDLHLTDVYVMTHVMEIRRTDGADFTAADAEPVLDALHVGISLALGRWAAPMLPVGVDGSGTIVWEDWRPGLCDRARSPSPGWWYEQDHAVLAEFLALVITAFSDMDRRTRVRMQMGLAIAATGDKGFVEQRIMIGFSGLEHVMWQNLVLNGSVAKNDFQRAHAAHNLRTVLTDAKIATNIDASVLPAIASLAALKANEGMNMDGAEAVAWTRNRLVHPDNRTQKVYQQAGLLAEVWLLLRHYLVLLILHSLGYKSSYRDLRSLSGQASITQKVPWA